MKLHRLFLIILVLVVFGGYVTEASAKNLILTDEQNEWLHENSSSVSFSPEKDFPPMIWSKYGVLFGVSKDYFDFIQQLIDVRFHVHEPRNLAEILESMKNRGEKNIIASRTITPERSEYLLFTRPYFSTPSIFISKNKKTLTGQEIEQKGYTVAVGDQFGTHEYLQNRYPTMKFLTFDNNYQVVQAIMNNQADVAAMDVTSLMYLIQENNFSNIRKIGDTGFIANFAFAVPKDLPILRDILDNAIEVIPQSFQKSILEKWGINSLDTQLLTNESNILSNGKNVDKGYVTTLVVSASLLIIFVEFALHRYILKREEEHHSENV